MGSRSCSDKIRLGAAVLAVTIAILMAHSAFATEFVTNGGLLRSLAGGGWCETNSSAFTSWALTSGATWYDDDALKTNSMGCPGATTLNLVQSFSIPGSLPYTLSFRHNENQWASPGTVVWSLGWAKATVYYYSNISQTALIGSDSTGNVTASTRNTWVTATMSKTTPANCVSAKVEIVAYSTLSGSYYGFTNVDDVSVTGCIPIVVTSHPQSQVKDVGQTATFSVTATGESPVYRWEKKPSGGSYAEVSGATSATYTTPALTLSDSGCKYRCKVTNSCTTLYSNEATLTVIAPVAVATVYEAKTRADGTVVRLPEKAISARTSSAYWIQDETLPCGIKVSSPAYPVAGSRVAITGTLQSELGERRIQPLTETWGTAGPAVQPYFMLTSSLGGVGLNQYSPGIVGAYGPNNLGLFVRIAGTVTNVGGSYYYIDDGVGLKDGTTTAGVDNLGVRVLASPGALAPSDKVTATGISSVFDSSGQARAALLPPGCTVPNSGLTVGATSSSICSGQSTAVTVSASEADVSYQLRNNAGNTAVGSPVIGTGGTISLPTGTLASTTTFNVLATRLIGGCSAQLTQTKMITVNPLPNPGLAVGAAQTQIEIGQSTSVTVANSQTGVNYQLRRHPDNSPVGTPVAGAGGAINLPTGTLSAPGLFTFNVLATTASGCSQQLTQTVTIMVGSLGTFTGKVKSATMQPVVGATVTTSPATTSATTDANGSYTIANVPAGTYNIIASKTGFQTHTWHYEVVTPGTTTTVPDHLLPRSWSKIGAHVVIGGRTGWGTFLKNSFNCGKPCQFVKCLDDFGAADTAKYGNVQEGVPPNPDVLTVGRFNDTPHYDLQGFDQYADPASPNYTPPAQFAQIIFEELTVNHVSEGKSWARHPEIDVWEICNEWSWWWSYQADFYIAMMDIAEAHGYRIAMYGCSGGNPPQNQWQHIARACFRAKQSGGHMLSLHEYAWSGTLREEYELHGDDIVTRYRRLYNYLREYIDPATGKKGADCPLVLTEVGNNGGGGFIGDEAFVADMGWYDDMCRQDDYVFGIASWTLGNWSGANWQTALPEMADYICSH